MTAAEDETRGSTLALAPGKGKPLEANDLDHMGPINYLVIEWPGKQPTGEAAPILIDLVDRGLIRVIDLAFVTKGEDGSIVELELSELASEVPQMADLVGATSG